MNWFPCEIINGTHKMFIAPQQEILGFDSFQYILLNIVYTLKTKTVGTS